MSLFLIALVLAGGCGSSKTSTPAPAPAPVMYGANGFILTPAGVQIGADRKSIPMPSEITVTPDGKTALVLSTGWDNYVTGRTHRITAIDAVTGTIVSSLSLKPLGYESFDGMAVNGPGTDVFVPGIGGASISAQRGFVLDVGIGANRSLSLKQAIPLQPYITSSFGSSSLQLWPTAAGIAVYGNTLLTANNVAYDSNGNQYPGETVSVIDLTTGVQKFTLTTGGGGLYPWAAAFTPDGQNAYVVNRQSNNGTGTVTVFNNISGIPSTVTTIQLDQVGSAAIISSLNGSKMYVANTLSDTVSVIDTATNTVSGTISLAMFVSEPTMGGLPNNFALSGDGKYLYVAMGADNAIAVIDTASDQVIGRIPTASYPSGVAFDTANNHIFVSNMYGIEHGPFAPTTVSEVFNMANYVWYVFGSVSDIPQPSTVQLAAYTKQVLANDFVQPAHPAVPADIATAWSHIQHIVYILRENKTFDMEFGDLGAQAGGQPIPCPYLAAGSISAFTLLPSSFGCQTYGVGFTTPNTHALANQFALDTNFYLDIVPSIAGHPMSFQGMISDYLQRIWAINTGYGGFNRGLDSGDPVASVPSGTIFDALNKAGLTFSSFGQDMPQLYNGGSDPLVVPPAFDPTYGSFFSDVAKANYFIALYDTMVKNNSFPNFVFMSMGDDGYEPTTPPAAYSENDYATAMVVQAIANSKYWGSTAIFIDEDDPQPGIDHIDQERSFIIVISPYAKHGYISFAHYGFPAALRTIELMLGASTNKTIPPMTEFDATALPMYDLFTATADMTPYTSLPEEWGIYVK